MAHSRWVFMILIYYLVTIEPRGMISFTTEVNLVKRAWARVVLGMVTSWEVLVIAPLLIL